MSADKKHGKKAGKNDITEETKDGSGTGGKSGQIEFRDFLASAQHTRDDQLTGDEKKRLLSVHKDTHELVVKKQKETRDQRHDLKAGKISRQTWQQGLASGMGSQYKSHPALSNKAQFSGVDRQNTPVPEENIADTNNDKRNELQYQYNLRYAPENAPKFNPKPNPYR